MGRKKNPPRLEWARSDEGETELNLQYGGISFINIQDQKRVVNTFLWSRDSLG